VETPDSSQGVPARASLAQGCLLRLGQPRFAPLPKARIRYLRPGAAASWTPQRILADANVPVGPARRQPSFEVSVERLCRLGYTFGIPVAAMTMLQNLLVLATLVLLAGCTTPSPPDPVPDLASHEESPDSEPRTSEGPPANAPQGQSPPAAPAASGNDTAAKTVVTRREERIYSTTGFMVGADPADPLGPGSLAAGPVTRRDTFVAPPGTVNLTIEAVFSPGPYSGGIEVVSDSGQVVYYRDWVMDDGLGDHFGLDTGGSGVRGPGNYTIIFRFVGVVRVTVTVDAIVEAATASEAGAAGEIVAYSSSGLLISAAPAHPLNDGPLLVGGPVRQDTFLAPAGTTDLNVRFQFARAFLGGAYSGGIEVADAEGKVVFREEDMLATGDVGYTYVRPYTWYAGSAAPGLYMVSYYAIGAGHIDVKVNAVIGE